MSKVRVAGAIASAHGITFYLEDGQELNFTSDSPVARQIVDETVDALGRDEVVEIDLDDYSVERKIEKKTGGLLRFIKTTARKLLGQDTGSTTETVHLGRLSRAEAPAAPAPSPVAPAQQFDPELDTEITAAVVKTPKGDVVVPGVEKLARHMEHAAQNSAVGFTRFMERIASVANERKHTVQELLNFMSRGDLPIADDGSIVAYKVLTTDRAPEGRFVDCHTHKVSQALGSHVSMPVSHVDDSRRTQCSTGLHIARRGYLRSFSGDVITIVKVAPEDVVAVPFNEPDKMRAAAYHIVGVLPKGVHQTLRENRAMTGDSAAAQLLADVIAGNHVGILDRVVIGAAKGENVAITKEDGAAAPTKSLGKTAKALDDTGAVAPVTVKEVRERVAKAKAEAPAPAPVKAPIVPPYVPLPTTNELKAGAKPVPMNDDKPAPKAAAKKAKAAPVKTEKAKPTKAAAEVKKLPDGHVEALRLRDKEGLSNREIERRLHICRKTLKKLFDAHPKAA